MFSMHMYLACAHSGPVHYFFFFACVVTSESPEGWSWIIHTGKGRGYEWWWEGSSGVQFPWHLWPKVFGREELAEVDVILKVVGRQTKRVEMWTALAKGFDDRCSFPSFWNADCAIFFVKQDSHWVEDKQLFIKRNQELLEKVCWAQHSSGAEEKVSDPGAAGGALRSGLGVWGKGRLLWRCSVLCYMLTCIPVTITCVALVCMALCWVLCRPERFDPWSTLICFPDICKDIYVYMYI